MEGGGRKRCAVYARMARCDDPAEMDAQVDALIRRAESKGIEVAGVFREVAPGCGGMENRPVLKGLLEDVSEGAYAALVVRDVSRLTRGDAESVGLAFDALALGRAALVTLDREYAPSDKHDANLRGLRL